MLYLEYTTQFKKDLKLSKKRNKNVKLLEEIIEKIVNEKSLEPRLRDHSLGGNWNGYRELHIQPDWLLIYKLDLKRRTIILVRLGSHSDLF